MRVLIGLAIAACMLGTLYTCRPAHAHDVWADNEPVAPWAKSACCGPEDSHHLRSDQVHAEKDGWRVDGYHALVPYGKELPSPDGTYWIFYRTFADGTQSNVYCFFTKFQGM